MIGARNRDRLGGLLAVAILMASVIFALAGTPDATPPRVRLELSQPRTFHAISLPGPIAQGGGAEEALSRLGAEQRCLADVIYFEARGESEAGQRAVAGVILHRLEEGSHGQTICDVVYEGAGQTFCQFTFACDGSTDEARLAGPWRSAQVLAARVLAGEVPADETNGATYYHSVAVHPNWAAGKLRLTQIGNHIFYRDPAAQVSAVLRGSLQ